MADTNTSSNEWQTAGQSQSWNYKEDKEIQGVYVGKKDDIGPNGSSMYDLRTTDGSIVGVWGSALLDDRFKGITEGEEVKITYVGDSLSPKTKRTFHNFEVLHRKIKNDIDF